MAEAIEKLSYAEYNARPGLRASYLATLDKTTPGSAEWERTHPADSASMRWGTALHCMILEPERFAAEYTIGGPINKKTGKPYGSDTVAFMDWALAQTKPILTREEHRLIVGMAESIAAHPIARTIRDGPRQTEVSIFWDIAGMPCKARIDCVQPKQIWDIKTCRDASYRGFQRSIADYCYHLAAAWYLTGWAELDKGSAPKYLWLAVENSPPYALAVYHASADLLQVGRERCAAAVARYLECKDNKHFPVSYADEPVLMAAPKWMLPDENSLEA